MIGTLGTLLLSTVLAAPAQDANFLLHPDSIEALLRDAPLQVLGARGSRAEGDRTTQLSLAFPGDLILNAKLAPAVPGGSAFNNEPRYELAAFALQRMFLGPDEYVVPPTVLRVVPTEWLQQWDDRARPTFRDASWTLILLQYWLLRVSPENVWDEARFERDTVYARHLANFNVLTYLIRHNDANTGNFLLSQEPGSPRVYSVDNGVAFRSDVSNRGWEWRDLRVKRLPHATVERLRALTPERLAALAVLVQFQRQGPALLPVAAGPNLDPGWGIRDRDGMIQLGLTEREIRDVAGRLRRLLEDVDEGKLRVF